MPTSCRELTESLESLKTLKKEFDLELQKGLQTGNLERAKELKKQLEEGGDTLESKLWPLESLQRKEILRQYESQKEVFTRVGLLEKLSNGELGIKAIDGKEYPFPTFKEITERIRENKEILNLKAEQGFTKLMLVPIGMTIEELSDLYDKRVEAHANTDPPTLFFPQTDPNKPKEPAERKNPNYLWDKLADDANVFYYPTSFTKENHGGITRAQLIEETKTKGTPGWEILMVEDMVNIPRAGNGQTLGKGTPAGERTQLEAGKSPEEYLKIQTTGKLQKDDPTSPYLHEHGFTTEAWLTRALIHLEERNEVTEDYQGSGSLAYLTGSYVPTSDYVPCGYWNRGGGRAFVGIGVPRGLSPVYGVLSSVRG